MSSVKKESVCRTCLGTEGEFISLYSDTPNIPNLIEKIMYISDVKIKKDDGLPCIICKKCVFHIEVFYCFKKQIESTNQKMNNTDLLIQKAQAGKMLNFKGEAPEEDTNDSDYEVQYISDEVKKEVETAFRRKEAIRNVNQITNVIMKNFQDMFLRIEDLISMKSETKFMDCKPFEKQKIYESEKLTKTKSDVSSQSSFCYTEENMQNDGGDSNIFPNCKYNPATSKNLMSENQGDVGGNTVELPNKEKSKSGPLQNLNFDEEECVIHEPEKMSITQQELSETCSQENEKDGNRLDVEYTNVETMFASSNSNCNALKNLDEANTEKAVWQSGPEVPNFQMTNFEEQRSTQATENSPVVPECPNLSTAILLETPNCQKLDDVEKETVETETYYDNEEEVTSVENPLRIEEEPMESDVVDNDGNNTAEVQNVADAENKAKSPITPYTDTEDSGIGKSENKNISEKSDESNVQMEDVESREKVKNDAVEDKENVKPSSIDRFKNNDVIVISSDSSSEKKRRAGTSKAWMTGRARKKLFQPRAAAKRNLPDGKKATEGAKSQTSAKKAGSQFKKYFQCTSCDINLFTVPAVLFHHNRFHTPPEELLFCQMCEIQFPNKNVLFDHFVQHAESHLYRCFFCTCEFVLKKNLRLHMNAHLKPKVVEPENKRMKIEETKENP